VRNFGGSSLDVKLSPVYLDIKLVWEGFERRAFTIYLWAIENVLSTNVEGRKEDEITSSRPLWGF
jgi:hypothetical protein